MKEKFEKPELEEVIIDGRKYLRMGGILIPILDENGDPVLATPEEQPN